MYVCVCVCVYMYIFFLHYVLIRAHTRVGYFRHRVFQVDASMNFAGQ